MVTRLRLDAALYDPPTPRNPGQLGRPRLKGDRLPTIKSIIEDKNTCRTRIILARWYSHYDRPMEIISATAIWYHIGAKPVPIRWVGARDPLGKFPTQALLCTDPSVDPAQILSWFMLRWQVETTFQETRAHLGIETQRRGAIWRFSAPRRRCWVCSPSSPCWPIGVRNEEPCQFEEQHGMPKRPRRSPTP